MFLVLKRGMIWKQPKYPSTRKMWYIHERILLSHEKIGNFAICNNMDRLGVGGGGSLIAQLVKNLPAIQKTLVQSLGREDPLEKG